MRTVTFADTALLSYINDHFVLVWFNHAPEFSSGDAALGQPQPEFTPEQIAVYPEGGGGGNIRSFYCDPNGDIYHATQGYWSVRTYRKEAERALQMLHAKPKKSPSSVRSKIRASLQAEAKRLEQENPEEMSRPVRESVIRKKIAALRLLDQRYQESIPLISTPIQQRLATIRLENVRMQRFI